MPLPSLTDDLESQRLTEMSRKEPPEDCLEEARRRLGSKYIEDEQVDGMELPYEGINSSGSEKTDKSRSFDDDVGHSDRMEDADGAELVITRTDRSGKSSKTIYRVKEGEEKLEGLSNGNDESLDSDF
ncbi:hypothetical protein I203_105424 [Kwoniella mangroviensis CBS 8507]|uniref:uncharacterized protein n=1 Tax=Kwoniella mangroviensis CBS 8507 TaxID=1296122 RepID=UPI00080D3300|nr:uncharacterized protein I203_01237 [Kwoniella mangroviensis CBS 8507]OCF69380.1 hypothetical protein I203_01237 [Kwoniella mangroviensis CBS 8507]